MITRTSLPALAKRHILGILFALFVGAFVVAPQLVFIAREGEHYKGLYMMMNTESEWYYIARMHEFYDEGKIGNPYLFEHKFYGPIFISPGGETILAAPGKLLNIPVPTLNLIYKFLLPAITFLLLYVLIFRLTESAAWSIAGGLFFLVGSTWLYANNLSHFLQGDRSFFTEFVYNRAVHPEFDGVLTFLYLNVLLSAYKSQNVRWFITLAALLGLSFYTYFYSFTFFLALNAVGFLLWMYFGKRKDAWCLAAATVGGVLVGIPALWAISQAYSHPDYVNMSLVVEFVRHPVIGKNGIVVTLLFVVFLFRTKAFQTSGSLRNHAIFLLGLLITSFVVINQQILTGRDLYSGHYHHNFNIPIFIIVLMFLGAAVARSILSRDAMPGGEVQGDAPRVVPQGCTLYLRDLMLRALPWALSAVFIVTGILIQYFSYANDAPQASKDQRYMGALSWLEARTPKESVVMANEKLSNLIPIFTSNNVMWASLAPNYLMPPERTRFTPENLLRSDDFFRDIKQFRVDYILWDKRTDPGWNVDRFHLPTLYSGDDLTIYKLP